MANSHMTFGVDLLPKTTNTYNLGNSSQKWNLFADNISGLTKINSIITGTGTTAVTSGTKMPALWKFDLGIASPEEGDKVTIKVPVAGHGNGVFVSLDNGTTYYPVSVSGTSRLTTHYGANQVITLVCVGSGGTNEIYPAQTTINGNTYTLGTAANITGKHWCVLNYYDSGNTNTQMRVYRQTTGFNDDYPLLASRSLLSSIGTVGTNGSQSAVYGVVWNDSTKVPTLNPSTGLIKVPGGITAETFTGDGSALTNLNASNISSGTLNLTRLGNQNKNLVLAGPTTGDAAAPTFRALVAADIPDLSSTYLKLNGSNNMTADVNIIAGDTNKFINFWYNTGKKAGASWRIGMLGSGNNDTNYFIIQSGTSTSSGTTWNNVFRIGQDTFNIYIPSTTASTSTSTGALTVAGGLGVAGDVYATNLHGNLEVIAHTNTTNGTKNYYPWFSTATSGNLAAKAHSAFYLYETVTDTKISKIDACIGATDITGTLTLWDGSSHYVNIKPTNLSSYRNFTLPDAEGTITIGSGSSTDNAIARYDGTLGKLQNSGVIISDSNNVIIPGSMLKITAETGPKYILLGNQDNAGANCPVIFEGVNGSLYIGNGTSWSENGGTLNTALYMSKARKIGIGTTTPVTELDVNGTTTALTYKITSNATITYNSTSGCVEIIV